MPLRGIECTKNKSSTPDSHNFTNHMIVLINLKSRSWLVLAVSVLINRRREWAALRKSRAMLDFFVFATTHTL